MLIFGKSVSDWKEKANYAQDKADNEFAKIHEVRCEGLLDVQTAMETMAAFAADSKCKKFLYHATINLNPGERLTHEQWMKAVDTLEKNLNLTDHYRVVFEHIKKDRQHYHIVWSRKQSGLRRDLLRQTLSQRCHPQPAPSSLGRAATAP